MALEPEHRFTRTDLFGGNGDVEMWNILPQTATPPFTTALWCRLEPNGYVGEHVQQACPEVVICIKGAGHATVDGRGHPLTAGAMVYLPLGQRLTLRNHSEEHWLEYLIIKAQASAR